MILIVVMLLLAVFLIPYPYSGGESIIQHTFQKFRH